MSLSHILRLGLKAFSNRKNGLFIRILTPQKQILNFNQERDFRKAYARFLKTMKSRRKLAGPGHVLKRSEWIEWNYNAELYAFNKRLKEDISEENLRRIFIHNSYVEKEQKSRKEMEVADVPLNLVSNSDLISSGQEIMSNFIKCYVRQSYPLMPEDGVCSVHNYLMSNSVLSYVSLHLGTKDLIFCAEYPPEEKTLAETLKATVGAIASSDSINRAEHFVLDFVCTRLIGKDVLEIWEFDNPLQILNSVLRKQNREPSESRLIFESGRNTIEAIYYIGLYSNRDFLGKGFGETLPFAEEMAAYDALRRVFGLNESFKTLAFGSCAKKLEFKAVEEHKSLAEITDCTSSLNNVSSV